METLTAISRWLAKQHVVTWCVQHEGELWCANAFYLFDAQKVAFYVLTEEKTRHAQMSGPRAPVAGTVSRKRWRGFAEYSLKGRSASLRERKAMRRVRPISAAFLSPECCLRQYGKSAWMKSNSLTTRWDLAKKCTGYAARSVAYS